MFTLYLGVLCVTVCTLCLCVLCVNVCTLCLGLLCVGSGQPAPLRVDGGRVETDREH